MSRYVDAEKMPSGPSWDALNDTEKAAVLSFLIQLPTADVKEIRYGYWIMDWDDLWPEDSQIICSVCRGRQPMTINDDSYCPKCGAEMSKKEK